jgi:lipopolysaccharide transport system ATP-binding protein
MSWAIRVKNLSKRYELARVGETTMGEAIAAGLRRGVRRAKDLVRGRSTAPEADPDGYWALKDVSFDLRQGEILGVIGANGAGKSTLLKILSKVVVPTEGEVEVYGRIGSLLEVGTGFNPELTGAENIYLYGSILGMSRAEIAARYDEITAFAELGRFIDEPIKHYSSGMHSRLGFAVAAHLQCDILLIDEVLAVGDAAFQRKCLDKMESVTGQGRTVIFVSHNMAAVNNLCHRAIVLEKGRLTFDGDVADAARTYLAALETQGLGEAQQNPVRLPADPSRDAKIREIALRDGNGDLSTSIAYQDEFEIALTIDLYRPGRDYYAVILLQDPLGVNVMVTADDDLQDSLIAERPPGTYRLSTRFPARLLKPGLYRIVCSVVRRKEGKIDRLDAAIKFEIVDHLSRRAQKNTYRPRVLVAPELPWRIETLTAEAARAAE